MTAAEPNSIDLRALAGVDLNLLLLLHALLTERHVTRAAARVRTSQPAMSRALARARALFGDPLLVRSGGAFLPTARAQELLPRLSEALRATQDLLRPTAFEPASARGTVRVAMPDAVAFVLLPAILRRFSVHAPGLDLQVVQWQPDWRGLLDRGELDATVGFPAGTEPELHARPLFESEWVAVLRKGHPALRRRWDAERYASLDHLTITLPGPAGVSVDDVLAAHGLRRRVALRVPYPLLTPFLVADSDLVLTIVRWLATRLAGHMGLVIRRPPIELPRVRVPLVWHARAHHDPRHRWMRQQLIEAAETLDAESPGA